MNIASEYKSDAIFYAGIIGIIGIIGSNPILPIIPIILITLITPVRSLPLSEKGSFPNKTTAANFAAVIVGRD